MRINAEPLNSASKAVVDGRKSEWQAGDEILFSNGVKKTVQSENGQFYINSESITSGLSAVCPASLVEGSAVVLPATYQYRTDNSGHQVVDMPIAAYYDGSEALFFKHLTGGLYFNITNNTGSAVLLDRITVENATHYMNGSSLSIAAIDATFLNGDRVFTSSGNDAERKRVSLLFNSGLALNNGESQQVLVPIPAYASDAAFTVTVYAHNGEVSCFHFDKTQSSERIGHISASQAGYANISLGNNQYAQPFEGNGTYASPYQIYTKEDYKRMVDSVNGINAATYRSKHYDIAADIDMGGETVNGMHNFAGVIDGKGHTISNICFGNNRSSDTLGMITSIRNENKDTIRNLTLDHVSFIAGGKYVGAFVGFASARWTYVNLINCHLGHITYNTLSSTAIVGGMVGYLCKTATSQHTSTIFDCTIDQPIVLTTTECINLTFGGILGYAKYLTSTKIIRECAINADISINAPNAQVYFGGLVGIADGTFTLTNDTVASGTCFNLTAKGPLYAGALMGKWAGYIVNFQECYIPAEAMNCTMTSSNVCEAGGIVGRGADGTNSKTFTDCTVGGSITVTKNSSNASCYLGQVCGEGSSFIKWNDRGNSASVSLTVTNEDSSNDHIGVVYGNE